MIDQFTNIEIELNNDYSDASTIELDGICLASANCWDYHKDGIPPEIQKSIHDTIKRVSKILEDYRDGKLVYSNSADMCKK